MLVTDQLRMHVSGLLERRHLIQHTPARHLSCYSQLEHLGIYMTGSEFRKLWRQFDASGDGKINFTEFNNRVGQFILPYASGLQMKRPETPKMREWQRQALAKGIQKKVKDIEAGAQSSHGDAYARIQAHAPHPHP